MELNDYNSYCVISNIKESRENVLIINDREALLKRCKSEYKESFPI